MGGQGGLQRAAQCHASRCHRPPACLLHACLELLLADDYQGCLEIGLEQEANGAHKAVFAMLDPAQIGVTLTENMEMVPEQTTSAIVAHHPQAKYFAV